MVWLGVATGTHGSKTCRHRAHSQLACVQPTERYEEFRAAIAGERRQVRHCAWALVALHQGLAGRK